MTYLRRFKTLIIVLTVSFVVSLSIVIAYEVSTYTTVENNSLPIRYAATTKHKKIKDIAQNKVKLGIYPLEVYDIDFQRSTYKMIAYVWMSWENQQHSITNEVLYPPETLEIMNLVDTSDYKQTELISDTMSNGKNYYLMKIDGTFFQDFDVNKYPLDKQYLTVIFEDVAWLDTELVYLPDLVDTRLQDGISIPGWEIQEILYLSDTHSYESKFGYEDDEKFYAYSQLRFGILIKRPMQYFIFKFVFPLGIIIMFSLMSLWIYLNQFEVRIALSGSSLLNLVFLQQLYNDKIITSRQLVLMDFLYIWSYISIILTLAELIYSHYQYVKSLDESKIMKRNRVISFVHLLIFVLIVLYAFLSS